jgi:hypothetical protein
MNQEAFDAGYDAYWDGAALTDNPYDDVVEIADFQAWEEGWRKARVHDYDESEG